MQISKRQLDLLIFIRDNAPCAQWQVAEGCGISFATAWSWCVTLKCREVITYEEAVYESVVLTDKGKVALDKLSFA